MTEVELQTEYEMSNWIVLMKAFLQSCGERDLKRFDIDR